MTRFVYRKTDLNKLTQYAVKIDGMQAEQNETGVNIVTTIKHSIGNNVVDIRDLILWLANDAFNCRLNRVLCARWCPLLRQ